ncbi:MAG: nucleotidyltransferase family protein [Candidatus Ozemobacteraceae bacterium]
MNAAIDFLQELIRFSPGKREPSMPLSGDTPDSELSARMNSFTRDDWTQFENLLRTNMISCFVFHRLKSHGLEKILPADLANRLSKSYLINAGRNLRFFGEIVKMAKAFHAEGIPIIVLKGNHLTRKVYENIALREMVDIDILVRKSDAKRAFAIAHKNGYIPNKDFQIENMELLSNHFDLKPKNGISFEIHWNIRVRDPQIPCLPIDRFWSRASKEVFGDAEVFLFSVEDLLLHLCFHAVYHHRLLRLDCRTLIDIASILSKYSDSFNWDMFIKEAEIPGFRRAVLLCLKLSHDLLGTPVPKYVWEKLGLTLECESVVEALKENFFVQETLENDVTVIKNKFCFQQAQIQPTPLRKLKYYLRPFFPPWPELARHFGVSQASPFIFRFYVRRSIELLGKYMRTVLKIARDGNLQNNLHQKLEDKDTLENWILEMEK